MNLQFITDCKGETTGVFIPIEEWNILLKKYKELRDEAAALEIPEWHQELVAERMENYKKGTGSAVDFDAAIEDLNKNL